MYVKLRNFDVCFPHPFIIHRYAYTKPKRLLGLGGALSKLVKCAYIPDYLLNITT